MPQAIRCDNGPELTSASFSGVVHRAEDRVGAHPAGTADAERARGKFSREAAGRVLDVSWFGNLFEARRKIAAWREEYNEERPHSSLGYSDAGGVRASCCGAPVAYGSLRATTRRTG